MFIVLFPGAFMVTLLCTSIEMLVLLMAVMLLSIRTWFTVMLKLKFVVALVLYIVMLNVLTFPVMFIVSVWLNPVSGVVLLALCIRCLCLRSV